LADIESNIRLLKQQIHGTVKIVAVSKTRPASDIMIAYNAGQKVFGENRVNELISKRNELPGDIEWHFVGHLQTNKVKMLVGNVSMIQSVDSLRLIEMINREAEKAGIIVKCLLQFHIASEETKFGFNLEEARAALKSVKERNANLRICGVMGMATFTDDKDVVRDEFRYLAKCYNQLKSEYFPDDPCFNEISMGMSGDYKIAIEEGATIIRIGSLIFGERIQNKN
jgi:PLP dependent protein